MEKEPKKEEKESPSKKKKQKKNKIFYALIAIGILLMIAGLAWDVLTPDYNPNKHFCTAWEFHWEKTEFLNESTFIWDKPKHPISIHSGGIEYTFYDVVKLYKDPSLLTWDAKLTCLRWQDKQQECNNITKVCELK